MDSLSLPLHVVAAIAVLSGVSDAQTTTRVSVDSSGAEANAASDGASISADGRYVAFHSAASNLVAGDTNGTAEDVFVYDRGTGITELVSVDSSGIQGNSSSLDASISGDGRFVAFDSFGSNLVSGDTNGFLDVFVHDRVTGVTERVSVDSAGREGNFDSHAAAISADGAVVAFWSNASNLVSGDTNGWNDVFVHDRSTGVTERVSVDSAGFEANSGSGQFGIAISAAGTVVVFASQASNLVAGDANGASDVFVHDRATGATELASTDSAGVQGDSTSDSPAISSDGRFVVFASTATNLVAGDVNGSADIFTRDRQVGITDRVSVDALGAEANGRSLSPSISSDATSVTFRSSASNLVTGDSNGVEDVFVKDLSDGHVERASVDSTHGQGNHSSYGSAIAADRTVVVFWSDASNLVAGDTNALSDVFAYERCLTDATWTNYGTGFPGTHGVPSLTAESNPTLGSSLTVDVGNSFGKLTVALLFLGLQQTTIHSSWGCDLVVVPFITSAIGLPAGGTALTDDLPNEPSLCGVEVDLQVFESDPGASKGVSSTPGLQLILGH